MSLPFAFCGLHFTLMRVIRSLKESYMPSSTLRQWIALSLVLAVIANCVHAAELKPGMPAPKLHVSKWLNGEPIESLKLGTTYVVECWATWCGPCIAAIPHVSKLNTKFKDKGVVFIGMNVWEKSTAAVEPFVQKMGKNMNYRVALDVPGLEMGKTAEEWLKASGQEGIPCSFIVDKEGKIAWIGHPGKLEGVLTQVIEGKFDLQKYAEMEAKKQGVVEKLQAAAQEKDIDKLLAAADELAAVDPSAKQQMAAFKFTALLRMKKDYAAAYALLTKLAEKELKDDSETLNEIAWTILDTEGIEKRDFDLALKLAKRADELTQHENPAILDTLARAYFEKGDIKKAIEIETLAIEKVKGDANLEEGLIKTLNTYKEAASKKK